MCSFAQPYGEEMYKVSTVKENCDWIKELTQNIADYLCRWSYSSGQIWEAHGHSCQWAPTVYRLVNSLPATSASVHASSIKKWSNGQMLPEKSIWRQSLHYSYKEAGWLWWDLIWLYLIKWEMFLFYVESWSNWGMWQVFFLLMISSWKDVGIVWNCIHFCSLKTINGKWQMRIIWTPLEIKGS